MKKRSWFLWGVLLIATILLNLLAWFSQTFCDWYEQYIYPIFMNILGRFSSLFSISVGEVMLVAGVMLAAAALFLCLCMIIFAVFFGNTGFYHIFKQTCGIFYTGFAWVVAAVLIILTLNCFILYHASGFEKQYMAYGQEEYSLEELTAVRDMVVMRVNELSLLMERDERGEVIFSGNMEHAAIESMQALGETYELLKGYYPTPKEMAFSGFVSQQNMLGYYFPFSMEANYNKLACIMNKPATMCHELAHTKGFLYEDEANMIGFLACINSDDLVFQYSGYLSVLYYLDNDFYEALGEDKEAYYEHVSISPQVLRDNLFITDETRTQVEENALIKTEYVSKAANEFLEVNLHMNGVEEGTVSYTRVVGLVLNYYRAEAESLG